MGVSGVGASATFTLNPNASLTASRTGVIAGTSAATITGGAHGIFSGPLPGHAELHPRRVHRGGHSSRAAGVPRRAGLEQQLHADARQRLPAPVTPLAAVAVSVSRQVPATATTVALGWLDETGKPRGELARAPIDKP